MRHPDYNFSVFINCPFDDAYSDLMDCLIFVIQDCGFIPRCALEIIDASQIRIQRISAIIEECKFGIHDISRTELDTRNKLPRFNMPLELGIFLGAKTFGRPEQGRKNCIILDKRMYRYQKFISDIAGQDIYSHNNRSRNLIRVIRDWLSSMSRSMAIIPSGSIIYKRFGEYKKDLPIFM